MIPIRACAALLAAALVAGCVNVLPEGGPAPDVYRLSETEAAAARRAEAARYSFTTGWVVVVPQPLSSRALDTDRLAVLTADGKLSYAAGARWDEAAPQVVQESVITRLEADSRFAAALRPEDGVAGDYQLRLDLRRFEADYAAGENAAPTVHVALRARLIRRDGRALVATGRIETSARASENRVGAIVDAFDQALNEATEDLARWVIDAGAASALEPEVEPEVESAVEDRPTVSPN